MIDIGCSYSWFPLTLKQDIAFGTTQKQTQSFNTLKYQYHIEDLFHRRRNKSITHIAQA